MCDVSKLSNQNMLFISVVRPYQRTLVVVELIHHSRSFAKWHNATLKTIPSFIMRCLSLVDSIFDFIVELEFDLHRFGHLVRFEIAVQDACFISKSLFDIMIDLVHITENSSSVAPGVFEVDAGKGALAHDDLNGFVVPAVFRFTMVIL